MQPPPGAACPKTLNGLECTDARLTGHDVDFDVPAGWTCASRADLQTTGAPVRVTIAAAAR